MKLASSVASLSFVAAPDWSPLDLAKDGLVLLDKNERITGINTKAGKLLPCMMSSVIGCDFWDILPRMISERYQRITSKALAACGHHTFVAHHKFEDSWLEYSFRRHPQGHAVHITDVAPLQTLRQSLDDSQSYNRLLFEENPNAMWIFDAESLRILAVNRAAVEFYGIRRERFVGLDTGALFPEGEGAALLGASGSGQLPGVHALSLQLCKQTRSDGQTVLVELCWGHISWNNSVAVLVSLADVADRHLADRTLRQDIAVLEQTAARLQGELDHAQRDLAALTYGMSNDLQGPLHAANGFAALLRDKYADALDASGRHYVNRIQASTRQVAKLVDDLGALVQLPALSDALDTIDLAALCRPMVQELRKRDPERVVTVEITAALLLADKALLATALMCLLENAWKFTAKKTEGWIKVALLAGQTPDEQVLQVSDNGSGFDAAYSANLFTPFQRLHSSADFAGNGLGLAIVKRVAQRHHGRVWAESGPTGASFFMAFAHAQPAAL